MFVRKKQNPSGVISVQIIDKSSGKYKVVKTIGSSSSLAEVDNLESQANKWLSENIKGIELDFSAHRAITENVLENIKQITSSGIDLLVSKIYREIGFDKIDDDLLRLLVIARLANPVSKLKTTDYLMKYHSLDIKVHNIYRFLDKLYSSDKEKVQQISYEHTLKVLGGTISVVFYDVTTLYFQIDNEDEIRKRGFSKEGKHQNPQIVLGLLVSVNGYPLAYDVFEGNKFEGHTFLPVLDAFKEKYNLTKLVVIADSGLLSLQNIEELQEKGYEFILGARIKNEKQVIKDKILALDIDNGKSQIIEKQDGLRLIISYSEKRAKKDKHNRERGLERLKKQLKTGKLSKSNINNRGYNKYLQMEGEIKVSIDMDKFYDDSKWDGLKGYISNTSLSKQEVIESYGHLWKIEKAFRVSKHDLKIRPIYHRLQNRIEAHITINFIAYKIYKELERQLKEKRALLSPEKAIDIAKTIYSIKVKIPKSENIITKTLLLNDEQVWLADLFEF